jgi:hypothetical protein
MASAKKTIMQNWASFIETTFASFIPDDADPKVKRIAGTLEDIFDHGVIERMDRLQVFFTGQVDEIFEGALSSGQAFGITLPVTTYFVIPITNIENQQTHLETMDDIEDTARTMLSDVSYLTTFGCDNAIWRASTETETFDGIIVGRAVLCELYIQLVS